MKKNSDFYKVVNAVINTLNHGEKVAYVKEPLFSPKEAECFKCFYFTPDDDFKDVRNKLMEYMYCDELEDFDDINGDGWNEYEDFDKCFDKDYNPVIDFYRLWTAKKGVAGIQIAINPDNYVTSSYVLRDMICEDQDLKAAEITTGMNGYPRGLRGAVLLGGCGKTIEQMRELAEMYGVELVSLHRRDGWQLWESEGWTSDLYDYVAFMDQRNDNLHYWESYKDYADELREYAEDMDDEQAQDFLAEAERVKNWQLEKNEVLCAPNGYPYLLLDDVEKVDRMVDHFSYDSHNYTLALDCMIEK